MILILSSSRWNSITLKIVNVCTIYYKNATRTQVYSQFEHMFYKYEMKVNEDFDHRLQVDIVYVSVGCAVGFRFSIIVNYVLISRLFHIYVLYTILYAFDFHRYHFTQNRFNRFFYSISILASVFTHWLNRITQLVRVTISYGLLDYLVKCQKHRFDQIWCL